MTRLIEDLLDVARISRGTVEMQMGQCDLAEAVRRSVDVAQHNIEERQQTLAVDLPAERWLVWGDRTRLEQALGNILNNASKYTPREGHIWMTAEQRPAGDDAAEIVVRVRDAGIGITPDLLPDIFEMFKQGSVSPHRAPGLGLGLAIVRSVLSHHGANVSAHSTGHNQWSEFTIVVPLISADAQVETEPPRRPHSVEDAARRILVVDDNAGAADTLAALLRVRRHAVQVANDGRAALTIAAKEHPEIVFLDIAMPDMDGYEVARRLRRLPGLENVFLVAVTGFGRPEDRQAALDARFDEHVTKPLEPARLPLLLANRHGNSR